MEVKNCNKLGKIVLDGIDPSPRGTPMIEVIFELSTCGILKVTAKGKNDKIS